VWLDESGPFDFFDEQYPARINAEDGDIIITLTPAIGTSWEYDEIFEKARKYVRTKSFCDYVSTPSRPVKQIEFTDSTKDIVVFQASTYDNPTLSKAQIKKMYEDKPDPDGTLIPTRLYGIFTQASGRIFKDFNSKIHVVSSDKYLFSHDAIADWTLARAIDYHDGNPWAIIWAGITPQNECFVFYEWSPNPDSWITKDICYEMAKRSGKHLQYDLNLIDPYANTKQNNTGKTTVEDINNEFYNLKKEGICSGGYWTTWNTKGEVGRDTIKERLFNSLKCERPFNNKKVDRFGKETYLPTLWIVDKCRETSRSLKHWRKEKWSSNRQLVTKDPKGKPQQKFSHFCMCIEALFKDRRFRAKRSRIYKGMDYKSQYFQGRRNRRYA
jgi:hypothetical protein